MPRRARLVVAGIPWHIIQRGNNRSACFYHERDYQYYLETLAEQAKKFECDVHAYVLMTNHVHLLLTPHQKNSASQLMKHLGQRYVQYINRTYRRTGTLWEGRFKSCLTQSDNYVLACYRYIELNPVRANMVEHPGEYRWSSYRANGQGEEISWLVPHEQYWALAKDRESRVARYRRLFADQLSPAVMEEIREATQSNYALGSARFRAEIAEMLGRRVEKGKAGRPKLQQA